MNDALPPGLRAVIDRAQPLADRFHGAGHRLYFVGGVVRDHLLARHRDEQDLDATTDARPAVIKSLVADLADAVWTQGERFGTIGCTIGEQTYEITTHRAEQYDADSRKPTVAFGDHIDDDLARRDFTVNAMAVDLRSGELVDPHDGLGDLQRGVLRTPLDPHIAFSEDPLRMLRAARFRAGYDLTPDEALVTAMAELRDRMAIVSAERIRDELEKLILLDEPENGLAMLADTGLLGLVLPKLAHLDRYEAALRGERVSFVPADPAMRWAVFLGTNGAKGPDMTVGDLSALKFSGERTRDTIWFAKAMPWIDEPGLWGTDAPSLRRAAALAPNDRALTDIHDFVAAGRHGLDEPADDVVAHRAAYEALLAVEPDLADPAPLLTGETVCALLGISPGPKVGVAMRWLRDIRLEEGPIGLDAAADRLAAWWPTRA